VAALCLLALFTHMHVFWVAALLLALVKIPMPDFTGLLGRMAGSLEKIADATPGETGSEEIDRRDRDHQRRANVSNISRDAYTDDDDRNIRPAREASRAAPGREH
jgi:hypothetical protein